MSPCYKILLMHHLLSHGIVADLERVSTLASIRQVKGSIPLACICEDIESTSVELKVSEISCIGIYQQGTEIRTAAQQSVSNVG
jgi:hypothetical protein